MESDIILDSARRIQQDATKWAYKLGNHSGAVSVDELRDVISLVRDLAQTVAELATRVGGPSIHAQNRRLTMTEPSKERMDRFLALVPSAGWKRPPPIWNDCLRKALNDGLVTVGWGGILKIATEQLHTKKI